MRGLPAVEVLTRIELSDKEELFIIALGYGLPATSAATTAGWSVGSASRIMKKSYMREAMKAVRDNLDQAIRKIEAREARDEAAA